MKSIFSIKIFVLCAMLTAGAHAAIAENPSPQKPLPRTIIALYDSKVEGSIKYSKIHRIAQMPLNHLGLILEYHDIQKPLPNIKNRPDVRGILTWFLSDTYFANTYHYIDWALEAMLTGKKMVIMGSPAFFEDANKHPTSLSAVNRLLQMLGLRYEDNWSSLTYGIDIHYKDPLMMDYERTLFGQLPPFPHLSTVNSNTTTHLSAQPKNTSDNTINQLVVTNDNGGFCVEHFALFMEEDDENEIRQWFINPFAFFRKAYDTDDLPKPDTTTLAGRRIYYSHIDGDGWNNFTLLEAYEKKPKLSAEIVMERAIKAYPDLPVSVAPIAADLDPKWAAKDDSRKIARELFELPNVEVATHTYSHPFHWEFFANGDPERERPFLNRYPLGSWGQAASIQWLNSIFSSKKESHATSYAEGLSDIYDVPRGFATEPFDVRKEVNGSIAAINAFAPKDKGVAIMMWSGDTTPFEEAVRLTRAAGILNINGGDSRFDREYPSIAWVSPIGRQVGKERQIYASNSNENTYTDLWTGRYYGFKHLLLTIKNTESPKRLKPFNVYYHMYSGERHASLNALLNNLNYARTQEITPVTTSHYAGIANGFYTTQLIPMGVNKWRIKNRANLQTIRLDNSIFQLVDLDSSSGIIGTKHRQGSLYIYLDAAVEEPIIALKKHSDYSHSATAKRPYLIHSRYPIWDFKQQAQQFSFKAQGFGNADMQWYVPKDGTYTITFSGINATDTAPISATAQNHILTIQSDHDPSKDSVIEVVIRSR